MESAQPGLVHYIPILTTLLSATFLFLLLRRARQRQWAPHLVWWAAGIFAYGIGTALESTITLAGNTVELNKAWYIAGAIFGGYPLAQGSVYLHFPRAKAHMLTVASLSVALILTVGVLFSPVDIAVMESHKPAGAILEWTWIRFPGTMIINTYALIFLVGTACWSALRFFTVNLNAGRAWGNVLISFGALLPGIGGGMAKAGIVEALYIGEFVGIIFIWAGYAACIRAPKPTAAHQLDAHDTAITPNARESVVVATDASRTSQTHSMT